MKLDINETMKELMGLKEQLGEFSLDLYYNDVEEYKNTAFTAKLHWPSGERNEEGNGGYYKQHEHHERAENFDVALAQTELFLKDIIRQGKRIYEV